MFHQYGNPARKLNGFAQHLKPCFNHFIDMNNCSALNKVSIWIDNHKIMKKMVQSSIVSPSAQVKIAVRMIEWDEFGENPDEARRE